MLLPPLTFETRVPRRFKELSSASHGKISGIAGLLDFLRDVLIHAAGPGEEPKSITEITGGIVRVEKLGEKYSLLHNFGMSDVLYYLRVAQAFGVIEVVPFTEMPKKLNEVGVVRSKPADLVVKTLGDPTTAFVYSFYVGLMLPTPARYTLFKGAESPSIYSLALRDDFRRSLVYNSVLAAQVLMRAPEEPVNKPWFEPLSDLSGIVAFLGVLQVAKIRPSPNTLLRLRVLSKIKRKIVQHPVYGELLLPRGTLLLEYEYLVSGRERDERLGIDYRELNIGYARDVTWFRNKVPTKAYTALEKLYPVLREKWSELEDYAYRTFNLERVEWYRVPREVEEAKAESKAS